MKNKITPIVLLAVSLYIFPAFSFAQREIATQNYENTTDGTPISIKKYENISGTPYITDGWMKGIVKLQNGNIYKDINIKYDQVADELHFENSKGQELQFLVQVSEFETTSLKNDTGEPLRFKKGFGNNQKAFYQILADGNTTLIKRNRKVIVDKTPFNSATSTKVFEPQIRYYLYINTEIIPVKTNKKSILSVLSDKKTALDEYINKEKLDLTSDSDLSKLIDLYNSL